MSDQILSVREVQLHCFSIMKVFDAFCREHGLTYYLSGGTLLGAVRHKGFIPWDDDVDLMMPRPDYLRFLALSKDFNDPRWGIFAPELKKDYSRAFLRMTDESTKLLKPSRYGDDTAATYIDIFPIDGVPAGKTATKLFYARIRLCDALCKCAKRQFTDEHERMRLAKNILRIILKPVGAHFFAMRMNRIAMKAPYEGSSYRGVSMVTHYGAREKMPAEVFDHAVDVEFEGMMLPAPCGWDQYLSRLYGDYMQLPPEHRRKSGHISQYQTSEEAGA